MRLILLLAMLISSFSAFAQCPATEQERNEQAHEHVKQQRLIKIEIKHYMEMITPENREEIMETYIYPLQARLEQHEWAERELKDCRYNWPEPNPDYCPGTEAEANLQMSNNDYRIYEIDTEIYGLFQIMNEGNREVILAEIAKLNTESGMLRISNMRLRNCKY